MRYIWQNKNWTEFWWNNGVLVRQLGRARLRQGKLLSKVDALGLKFSTETRAEILIEETVKTAAIEGMTLQRDSVRSSVARRLGLPTAGLPASTPAADGLVDVLLDVPEYRKHCAGLGHIPTASYYNSYGVNYNEFEAELKKDEVDPRLPFTFRTAARHGSGPKMRFEGIPNNSGRLNVALLEVVELIKPLATLPWGVEEAA